jgi:hypothetical protein
MHSAYACLRVTAAQETRNRRHFHHLHYSFQPLHVTLIFSRGADKCRLIPSKLRFQEAGKWITLSVSSVAIKEHVNLASAVIA